MNRIRFLIVLAGVLCCSGTVGAQEKKPFTPEDLWRFKGVSEPQLSPDGKWATFVVSVTDREENKKDSDIWVVSSRGGEPRQLTTSPKGDTSPRWSPDGKTIAFVSAREEDDQIWLLPFEGGEAKKLTDFPGGVSEIHWTPDGTSLIFVGRVYHECEDIECTRERDEEKKENKVKAMVHDHLLYRHWSTYEDGKADHLFIISADGGAPRDLTPDLKFDALTYWLASAGREYDISPDGQYVYFAGNQDEDQAVSYNTEVYRIHSGGGEIEKLTHNPAADNQPRLSPDGKRLAYRATRRPGYESDRYELMVMDLTTRETESLTGNVDLSVGALFWAPDGKAIYFEAEDRGDANLFAISAEGGEVRTVIGGDGPTGRGYHFDCQLSRDGSFFIYSFRDMPHLYEIYRCDRNGQKVSAITRVNQELYDTYHFPDAEEIWFEGDGGTKVHGFLVKPFDFDADKKYPMMVRIHGGPQQMFGYAFRYEYAIFSGAGYVVFFCNPRGSTGYGQEFCDQIRGDWSGRCFRDLKAGVRYVLDRYPYVDAKRVGAWGGSFGGFMVNWIEGHNEDNMFAALVSHAGDADQWSAYGSTEELWFPEWDMLGTPWDNPGLYDELSPIRYAKNFRTPMLITHGELDYRVPITGGEQMFTALQRLGVPSKMIRFPDEDHWIMKPQNREFWYRSILNWFDQWLKADTE
ncbi:MAG: S9 family peptidase [Gemmatimonadota bacterium]|nr:MAG: S9 family peptidase [Gemmatimonadota bacterium]